MLSERVPPSGNAPAVPSRLGPPAVLKTNDGTTVIEPERRGGYGRIGKKVVLSTNCYDVQISDNQLTWYRYEVIILLESRPRTDGTAGKPPRPPPKSVLRSFWMALEQSERSGSSDWFKRVFPVYDGASTCYTSAPLPNGGNIHISGFPAPDRPGQTISFVFKNPVAIVLNDIRNFIANKNTADVGHVNNALAALNTLFRHGPAALFPTTRTSFFLSKEAAKKLNVDGVEQVSEPIGGGLEIWRGFFQSIRTCSMGIQLNLDTTSSAFIREGSLKDFCQGFLAEQGAWLDMRYLGGLNLIRLNRVLQRLEVVVVRGPGIQPLKMKIRGRGVVPTTASQHRFDTPEGPTNVEDYLHRHFNLRLNHPDLPLVEVKTGAFYPIECIHICEGNRYTKKLSPAQQKAASNVQILRPFLRLGEIVRTREKILNAVSFDSLMSFGVVLDKDRKVLEARQLPPPLITYKHPQSHPQGPPVTVIVEPKNGEWQMKASRGSYAEKLIFGASLGRIAIIVPEERRSSVRELINALSSLFHNMRELGMRTESSLQRFPEVVYLKPRDEPMHVAVSRATDKAERVFGKVQFVFCLFSTLNSPDHSAFKLATTERGLASQALQESKCGQLATSVQMAVNVAMKINVKLRGYNFCLENGTTGGVLEDKKPLIMGADLSHEAEKPSIAVLVASMHDKAILYEEVVRMQRLEEPRPGAPEGTRTRKSEVILDMKEMALHLLRRRVVALNKLPPTSIVFYRDGVSESEFEAIIRKEVPALRAACAALKEDEEAVKTVGREALQNWHATITFIAALKRHHIRAFLDGGRGGTEREITNIYPGTVIDCGVTDARSHDWYAASHKGLIGTTRPTRYVVLVDESPVKLTADELETLTHSLTHTWQRATKAVSIPAPIYHSDLIARRIRPWVLTEDDSVSSVGNRQTRQADLEQAKQLLESTEAGRNSFRGVSSGPNKGPPAMWWI